MISGSNKQLQQELEYTLIKPDCHSWWISKLLWDNWGDERVWDEVHWHAHTRGVPWGLPQVVGTVQHVHCSRRRLLRRGQDFTYELSIKVPVQKKSGNLPYAPRTLPFVLHIIYSICMIYAVVLTFVFIIAIFWLLSSWDVFNWLFGVGGGETITFLNLNIKIQSKVLNNSQFAKHFIY